MGRLLYTSSNPSGLYLEDIIKSIKSELVEKSGVYTVLPEDVEENYLRSNRKIIKLLRKIERLQVAAVTYAAHNSNLTPSVISGVPVLTTPMSYSRYIMHHDIDSSTYGDDFEESGVYIVSDKGGINHSVWWLPLGLYELLVDK